MGEAVTALTQTNHADEGMGSRAMRWMREMYCGLHGHDNLVQFEKDRMFLQCASCGHETPGWALSEVAHPVVRARTEVRRAVMRPRLVSARRIA